VNPDKLFFLKRRGDDIMEIPLMDSAHGDPLFQTVKQSTVSSHSAKLLLYSGFISPAHLFRCFRSNRSKNCQRKTIQCA
jgi:hypothetical protein